MSTLYVMQDGSECGIDADMFILLYMPLELADEVNGYLKETGLDKKFDLIHGKISVRDEEENTLTDSISSLILQMKNDKVLFEYRLSGKHHRILDELGDRIYGEEE